jgi:nicotinamide-nucleotide amidase
MIKSALLSIGDEILIGQIVNSNSSWIAKEITNCACEVVKISTIGDGKQEIINELDDLLKIADLILITGGLGPTHDDITKQTICEYFNDTLVESAEWVAKLEKQFAARNWNLTPRNREQALIPSCSEILYNRIGTAPGMLITKGEKRIICMPGVPQEMKCIMEDAALPKIKEWVKESGEEAIIYKNIQTNGISESLLADTLEIDNSYLGQSSLAFLPSYKGVKLRIGAYGDNYDAAQKEMDRISDRIIGRVKNRIIAIDETPYPKILGDLLLQKGLTLSVAESCTSGMLGGEICSVSGASEYFRGGIIAYSNAIKTEVLGVDPSIIKSHGAVSEECAIDMANKCALNLKSDVSISITGIAGPDGGTADKPVGTIWIGYYVKGETFARKFHFGFEREMNRERAVQSAMAELILELQK